MEQNEDVINKIGLLDLKESNNRALGKSCNFLHCQVSFFFVGLCLV
jgi:hypothetical protein